MWITKGLCLICLLLALLFASGGTCGASGVQVTAQESELRTLLQNSMRQSQISEILQSNSTDLQRKIQEILKESDALKLELSELKASHQKLSKDYADLILLSRNQENSLTKINELFEKFSSEMKAKQKALEREKVIWQVLAVLAAGAAALK